MVVENGIGCIITRYSEIPSNLIKVFLEGYIFECSDMPPYDFFSGMEDTYPHFKKWFFEKIKPELGKLNSRRELLAVLKNDDQICIENFVGFAILKKTSKEKKICSFRIAPKERSKGYGNHLMQACFDYLHTSQPLITIPGKVKDDFRRILDRYQFRLKQERFNYYTEGEVEYVFNGYLKDASINVNANEKVSLSVK